MSEGMALADAPSGGRVPRALNAEPGMSHRSPGLHPIVAATWLLIGPALCPPAAADEPGSVLPAAPDSAHASWVARLEEGAGGGGEERAGRMWAYPLSLLAGDETGAAPPSKLDQSRSLTRLERRRALPGAGPGVDAARALQIAQRYHAATEYAQALVWYAAAAGQDREHALTPQVALGRLSAATALGDTGAVTACLVDLIGASDLSGRDEEAILALRWLSGRAVAGPRQLLERKLEAQAERLGPRVRCWRAFAAAQQGQWEPALAQLSALLAIPGADAALSPAERLWVAGAWPDLLLACGRRAQAASAYRTLADGPAACRAWALYQLATLDLAAGRYGEAGAAYARLCAEGEPSAWRPRACALSAVADTLLALVGRRAP